MFFVDCYKLFTTIRKNRRLAVVGSFGRKTNPTAPEVLHNAEDEFFA